MTQVTQDSMHQDPEKSEQAKSPEKKPNTPCNLIITGIMGCGKSTTGWVLARLLGYGFIDLDRLIEQTNAQSISEIISTKGENFFRQAEKDAIKSLAGIKNHVIALGGGAVMDDEIWRQLTEMGKIIWIKTPPSQISRRLVGLKGELAKRPLLADLERNSDSQTKNLEEFTRLSHEELMSQVTARVSALMGQRQERYSQADVILESSFSTPDVDAKNIKALLLREGIARSESDRSVFNRWHERPS